MHLIWHIFKKDFRHLRGLVAVYWLVLAAEVMLPWWLFSHVRYFPNVDDPAPYFRTELYLILFWAETFFFWVGAVLVAVMGVRLALADSPNVENARWRTLPVTRPKMLAAKILFLVFVAALPYCGAGILTKILQGMPMIDWLTGSGVAFILTLFWAIPAMLAAVLFESTTLRVIFFLGVVGIGLVIANETIQAGVNNPDQMTVGCVVVFFVLGMGLIVLRYLGTRKAVCTGLLLAALLGLWAALPTVLSALNEKNPAIMNYRRPENFIVYNFIQGYRPPTETTQSAMSIEPAGFTGAKSTLIGPDDEFGTSFPYHSFSLLGRIPALPNHLPEGEIALLDFWELTSGAWPRIDYKNKNLTAVENFDVTNLSGDGVPLNLPALAAAAGLGKLHFPDWDDAEPDAWPILMINETDYLPVKLPANVSGTLHYQIGTFRRVAEVPLQSQTSMTFGTSTLKLIDKAIYHPKEPQNTLKGFLDISRIGLKFGYQWTQVAPWPAVDDLPPLRPDIARYFYFLWNPQHGDCFLLSLNALVTARMRLHNSHLWKIQAFDTMFHLQGEETEVLFRYIENGQQRVMTNDEIDAWVKDARIVVVEFTPKHFYQAPATFGPLEHPPVAANP